MKVLITGANGQLAKELAQVQTQFPQFDCLFVDRQQLDIRDYGALAQAITGDTYAVINTAAYTKVDLAESEVENAYAINETAVGFLNDVCQERGVRLLHVSTDFVFDGQRNEALNELDNTEAVNVYGASKLAGEHLLMANPMATVVRTSWLYSGQGQNFLNTMLRLGAERDALNVVNDQVGSPTYARDLAVVLFELLAQQAPGGLYHFSNEGQCTWYDFAQKIMELGARTCALSPIPSSGYPTPAKRPAFSLLDKSKIKQVLNIEIDHWEVALQRCFADYPLNNK